MPIMKGFLVRTFITAFGLWIADAVLAGIRFEEVISLWLAAFLLGVTNAFVRPLVVILTLPITLLSLGLFLLIINGMMLMMVAALMPTFHIAGLGSAVAASIILSVTGWLANGYVGESGRVERWNRRRRLTERGQ